MFYGILASVLGLGLAATAAQGCGQIHQIKSGETLGKIAQDRLNDSAAYSVIYDLNKALIGPDPNVIEIGMTLSLPCGASGDTPAAAAPPDWSALLSPAGLADLKTDPAIQIVDLRSAKAAASGVIPGALPVPYSRWRGAKDNPGRPPTDAQLSTLIGETGLRLDRPIVLIHTKADPFDMGRAAYVYWLLKSVGAPRIAILEGGHAAWAAAKLPLADMPAAPEPYEIALTMSDRWYASLADVEDIGAGHTRGHLLDGRPSGMFAKRNDQGQSVPSTLPGAASMPAPGFYRLMGAEMPELEMLTHLKAQSVLWEAQPVVTFCNTGELGALTWFYASELTGIENVKLYPESTKGWLAAGLELVVPSLN
ncbi:rhodanese-like domain-containing protein [Aestuariibius insulae]|uniref:rhodanese-like domain-containing protein n=1 Tax=Aestuariibius insulae TaxID=2058287 RepID=UPI00345E51B4